MARCAQPFRDWAVTRLLPPESARLGGIAGESTFTRVLRAHGQMNHRGRARARGCSAATNDVHRHHDGQAGTARRQRRDAQGDDGAGDALLAGVKPSYSRPRAGENNAYAESLLRAAKYRPELPPKGFADLEQARTWAGNCVSLYNVDYRRSGIRYFSPAPLRTGDEHVILAARHALHRAAHAFNPVRWSCETRNLPTIDAATLNPEREPVVTVSPTAVDLRPRAPKLASTHIRSERPLSVTILASEFRGLQSTAKRRSVTSAPR